MLLPTKPPPTEASALLGAAADSPRAGVPKTDEPPPPVISSEGLQRFPEGLGLCGGVRDDGRRRARHCAADWTTGFAWFSKTLSASLFMFFATFFSTVALGVLISRLTSQRIGLSEFLLMNSVAGVAHALLGAQPLLILRPTGPITAIVSKLSDLADAFHLDFYQYLAATGVGVSVLMLLVAATEFSRHIRRLTPFTHEIFNCFVCSIYVHDGITQIVGRFDGVHGGAPFGTALFAANLALVVVVLALLLHGAPRWALLPAGARQLLADYCVTLAVLGVAALSYAFDGASVERIALPTSFGPTCYLNGTDAASREWVIGCGG